MYKNKNKLKKAGESASPIYERGQSGPPGILPVLPMATPGLFEWVY